MTGALPVVLMHQGGWDEALAVVGPLGVVITLVVLARRGRPDPGEDGGDDEA